MNTCSLSGRKIQNSAPLSQLNHHLVSAAADILPPVSYEISWNSVLPGCPADWSNGLDGIRWVGYLNRVGHKAKVWRFVGCRELLGQDSPHESELTSGSIGQRERWFLQPPESKWSQWLLSLLILSLLCTHKPTIFNKSHSTERGSMVREVTMQHNNVAKARAGKLPAAVKRASFSSAAVPGHLTVNVVIYIFYTRLKWQNAPAQLFLCPYWYWWSELTGWIWQRRL